MSEPTTIEHAIAAARPAEQRPLAAELATLFAGLTVPAEAATPLPRTLQPPSPALPRHRWPKAQPQADWCAR